MNKARVLEELGNAIKHLTLAKTRAFLNLPNKTELFQSVQQAKDSIGYAEAAFGEQETKFGGTSGD